MIRVLHVLSGMDRGGLETLIMNIYRNVDRTQVQFDFLVHTDRECAYDKEISVLGGKIYRIPCRRSGILRNHRALNDFFKNHPEYRIVHQHVTSSSYIHPLRIARKYKVPIRIIHSHNTRDVGVIHNALHRLNKRLIRTCATHYFSCSSLAARWLYPKKQYDAGKFILINNGIDTKKFRFDERLRGEKRRELGIEGKVVIGHIGRFERQKNHDFLIDIFNAVHDRCDNAVLLLIGDGPLRNSIEEKVASLSLSSKVIFTGVRSDIPALLSAMDVFVMPSLYEGLPVVLVEAQASGLPCVVSTSITDEVAILPSLRWCDLEDDASTWAREILEASRENTHRSSAYLQVIEAGYDIADVARLLVEVYQESYLNVYPG